MSDFQTTPALFARPDGVMVTNFAVGAGGWSSQDLYTRFVADVNGDGYNDIVGYGFEGIVVSFGSARGTFGEPALMLGLYGLGDGWGGNNVEPRYVRDMNSDGIADLVVFDSGAVQIRLGSPDGEFYSPRYGSDATTFGNTNFTVAQGWTSQDAYPRTVGDVTGDGKVDQIGFGAAGTWVAVNLNSVIPVFSEDRFFLDDFGVDQGWTSNDLFYRTIADVNGDGVDDIIGFGFAGTLVALADKNGGFHGAGLALDDFGRDQGWSSQNAFPRQLADVNGDGRADIVGFGIDGVLVAFGQADGTFTDPILTIGDFNQANGWTSNDMFPRILADFDNDGRIDIVGFGAAGVLVGYNLGGFDGA